MSLHTIIGGLIFGGVLGVVVSVFIYTTFYNSITGEWNFRLQKDEVLD